MLPPALASMARRENPPAKNIAMPWTTDPQYRVHRRPIRSRVKTQTSVANYTRNQSVSGMILPMHRERTM